MPMWRVASLVMNEGNSLGQGYNRPTGCSAGKAPHATFKLFFLGTEYFKHGIYSPFFPLQNAVCFIILTYLVPVLFTFYIQGVLKLKKNSSCAKRLIILMLLVCNWY